MKPSLRFLALVVVGWIGVRWAMVGSFPGASLFEPTRSEAKGTSDLVQTQFPAIAPLAAAATTPQGVIGAPVGTDVQPQPAAMPVYYYGVQSVQVPLGPLRMRTAGVPVYFGVGSVRVPLPPASSAPATPLTAILPAPQPAIDPQYPPLDDFPLSRLASLAWPQHSSAVIAAGQSVPALPANHVDRLQLSMWAMLRSTQSLVSAPAPSLATGGTLGGSQAGARLFYNFNRRIAAVLRFSNDVGRRGGRGRARRPRPPAAIRPRLDHRRAPPGAR